MLNEKDISDNINLLITPIKGKPGKIVKSSIYLETQLLGKTLKETNVPEQIIFTEKLFEENTDACIDTNLFELGMDLSSGEQRALMSIQKLLTDSDYKGQIIERYDQETVRRYGVPSSAPVLKITPAEYYESYGIRKYDTKRGKREYSGKEKSNAMMSLMDLAKPRKLWMTKSYENEKGEHRYQLVFHEAPILSITRVYNDLKSEEIEDIVEGGKAST